MVKKNIFRATAVIALLLIFFVLFLAYRYNKSYNDVIHKDAKSIIKINVDGIYKSIAFNFLQNPGYYLSKNDKDDKLGEAKNGLSFPSNIFLFTINGMANDTFFGSLPLSNINDFRNYAKNKWNISKFEIKDGLLVGKNQNQKITIAIFKNRIAFSYSNKNEATFSILKDLLSRKNILAVDDIVLSKLKNNSDHLFYLYGKTKVFANFNAGNMTIGGLLPQLHQNQQEIQFNPKSAVQFYINAQLPSFGKSDFQIDNYSLKLDSISKYHNGLTTFELIKTTKQSDTVITYEYNDDFEKVEQVTIKMVMVPEMVVTLKSNGIGLANYLKSEGVLDYNNVLNKKVFPLYTTYAKFDTQNFSLSTSNEIKQQVAQKTQGTLYLKIDFNQLRQNKELGLINRYLKPLQKLEVKTDNNGKLSGLMQFNEPNINALLQLK